MDTVTTCAIVALFVCMMVGTYLTLCSRYLFTGTLPEYLT